MTVPGWRIAKDMHGITRNSPVTLLSYLAAPNAWQVQLANGVIVTAADEDLHLGADE